MRQLALRPSSFNKTLRSVFGLVWTDFDSSWLRWFSSWIYIFRSLMIDFWVWSGNLISAGKLWVNRETWMNEIVFEWNEIEKLQKQERIEPKKGDRLIWFYGQRQKMQNMQIKRETNRFILLHRCSICIRMRRAHWTFYVVFALRKVFRQNRIEWNF